MSWLIKFFSKFPGVVALICIGVALGLLLKYPADWNPPDPTLNLLGGIVGSVGSVAAAFMVLKRQREIDVEKEALRAKAALGKLLGFMLPVVIAGKKRIRRNATPMGPKAIQLLENFQGDVKKCREDLRLHSFIFSELDVSGVEFFVMASMVLRDLEYMVSDIIKKSADPKFAGTDLHHSLHSIFVETFNSFVENVGEEMEGDHSQFKVK